MCWEEEMRETCGVRPVLPFSYHSPTGLHWCSRWQKVRQAEVDLEKELFEAELERLTTRERDLRRRIEDIHTAHPDINSEVARKPVTVVVSMPVLSRVPSGPDNGEEKLNGGHGTDGVDDGDQAPERKGKKRKIEARSYSCS